MNNKATPIQIIDRGLILPKPIMPSSQVVNDVQTSYNTAKSLLFLWLFMHALEKVMHATHFDSIEFDDALIAKYNQQGPRYTSYPTALEFQPIADDLERVILSTQDDDTPLSLYFHVPFCRHLCYYCGCNKIITKKNSDAGDYLDYLIAEIKLKHALLPKNRTVKQIHLGGGTPTFLSDDELVKLWQAISEHFTISDDGDFSIEIDPRELRPTTLSTLRQLGFNRLSFGVQDLDESVQIAVNRVQSEALIREVCTQAVALGYQSVNVDLIYGLPKQTPESMASTVKQMIDMGVDRLSVFNYAHLPERFVAQRRIKDDDLPSPAHKLAMFKNTITTLTQAGYQYIGIDHFAKPNDSLAIAQRTGTLHRNFQGYTTLGDCDLVGFGVSSISQIGSHILQNHSDLSTYKQRMDSHQMPAIKHIQAHDDDLIRRYVIMNLLCHDRMDFDDIKVRFGVNADKYFAKELTQLHAMKQDGLLDIHAQGVQILSKGRVLGRSIAMVFDAYLGENQNRFSKVI